MKYEFAGYMIEAMQKIINLSKMVLIDSRRLVPSLPDYSEVEQGMIERYVTLVNDMTQIRIHAIRATEELKKLREYWGEDDEDTTGDPS